MILIKYESLKKKHMVNVIHLNILLGIMITRPLYLWLSQMTGYINKFNENKITISLMIKNEQLLKNYNKDGKKLKN